MTMQTRVPAFGPAPAGDEAAIRSTVADYYLGWYDGDAERMARALHPRLAKRGWNGGGDGDGDEPRLGEDTYDSMVAFTAAGRGVRSDPAARAFEVGPIVVYRDVASAHVHAVPYVDYLHLVRTGAGWRIINAVWCTP